MKISKKITSNIISIAMLFIMTEPIFSAQMETTQTVEKLSERINASEIIKNIQQERGIKLSNSLTNNISEQNVIDHINNNPLTEENLQANNTEISTIKESNAINLQRIAIDSSLSTFSTEGSTTNSNVNFKTLPVNTPTNSYINENESVSLTTGAMNFEKTILSLPGRNGLDLDISVKYNSQEAVVTKNEYEIAEEQRVSGYNSFAIGWSFNFPTILKNQEMYGYTTDTSLKLSNGSTYKIIGDSDSLSENKTLELENYKLDNISLVRIAETGEYMLTYSDGTKEYFDGTYGTITKRIDRFGNTILFEYSTIKYYRGSFVDYLLPSLYTVDLHALSKITDSVGRVINVDYTIEQTPNGCHISEINFILNRSIYATINLAKQQCYKGDVDTVTSIVDGEGQSTNFEYVQNLAYINYDLISIYYNINSCTFAISKITYPTGYTTKYEYEKMRSNYYYYNGLSIQEDWYEVFTTKKITDSAEKIHEYSFVGKMFANADCVSEEGRYVFENTNFDLEKGIHYAIVRTNYLETIHKFDEENRKIYEEVYDLSNTANEYLQSENSYHKVIVNDTLYQLGTQNYTLYIQKQDYNRAKAHFLPHYHSAGSLNHVKTKGNKIFAFIKNKSGEYRVLEFDTQTETWADGGNGFSANNIYYANGVFYAYEYNTSADTLTHHIYNPDNEIDTRTSSLTVSTTFSENNKLEHICSVGNLIYYKYATQIYCYNISNNTVTSKTINSLPGIENIKGFSIGNKTYVDISNEIYDFDYENGTISQIYQYPVQYDDNSDEIFLGADGSLYYVDAQNENDSLQYIYRFIPESENSWELVNYRLFDNTEFKTFASSNYIFFILEKGLEKIDFNTTTKSRFRTDYTYNSYNQPLTSKKTVFSGNEQKILEETATNYVNGQNLVLNHTDNLGNITAYEYTDSTYFIPTKETLYSETENAIVTTYTLSDDKTKILDSTIESDNKTLVTSYNYDNIYPGNVISETVLEISMDGPLELNTINYTYDSNNAFITQKKLKNIITNGTDFELQNPIDITLSYTYDNLGRLSSETDANGNTTTYTYDKLNRPKRTGYPNGTYTLNTYESANKVITSYSNRYKITNYYDDSGRLSKKTKQLGNSDEQWVEWYTYLPAENSIMIDKPNSFYYCTYDSYERPIATYAINIHGAAIHEEYTEYDDFNISHTINTYGNSDNQIKTITYNPEGQIIKEEQATSSGLNCTTYDYNYMSKLVKTTDSLENSVTTTYDDLGQVLSVTDQMLQTTSYEYDSMGNVTKITLPSGKELLNEYDNLNRLIKQTTPGNCSEYYAYDNCGNIIASKDKKGQVTTTTYNNMNKPLVIQTNTLSVSCTYDNYGNVATMSDSTGVTEYTYQADNLLTSKTTPDDKTISYSYDIFGNIVEVNDYAGNEYTYDYDALDRIEYIKNGNDILAEYSYSVDNVKNIAYPEGTVAYTYDNAGRIISQTNRFSDRTVMSQYDYTYDILGNQIQKKETLSDGTEKITNYTYDALCRLTTESAPDGTVTTYTFNSENNITQKNITHPVGYEYSFEQSGTEHLINNISAHNISYTYNEQNQLLSHTENIIGESDTHSGQIHIPTVYTYDANGNTLTKSVSGQNVAEYTYNALNQLTQFKDANNNITTYNYDGIGMRVSKTQGNTVHKYYWDRNYVSNETVGSNFTASNYIGIQGIFAREENNSVNYLFKNAHGDVKNIVNNDISLNDYDYDAYGNQYNLYVNDTNPLRYCGEYFDEESGLIYLRNRYYDPSIGRFTTEDPINDGINWYMYCSGNPITFVDPSGLESFVFVAENMKEQGIVRGEYYTKKYGTYSYIIPVASAENFVYKWNVYFSSCSMSDINVDAIEIISHGSASGEQLKATGFMYFFNKDERLYARNVERMNEWSYSVDSLMKVEAKELNIPSCNSANPDIYNTVYGFMGIVSANSYSGFDGGAQWDASIGDHIRGSGEYGYTLTHPFDPTYYVIKYQATWWKYVQKNSDGSPKRTRIGRRTFSK